MAADQSPPVFGTTVPIWVPNPDQAERVVPGENYFQIGIRQASAAFFGPFWKKATQLVVTSEVELNHPPFADGRLTSLNRIREIKRNASTYLGLSKNLLDLTPAVMDRATVAVSFLLDTKNGLRTFAQLANDDDLLSVVSLAPGAAAVAKTVSSLATKVIDRFMAPGDKVPVLQFVGDFSIVGGRVNEGYYVILGSGQGGKSLPSPLPQQADLSFEGAELLWHDNPVTDWSYLVLEVDVVPTRGRALAGGEAWAKKLDEADALSRKIENDPFASTDRRRDVSTRCRELVFNADTLFGASPLFLPSERTAIIRRAYTDVRARVFPEGLAADLGAPGGPFPQDDLARLGVVSQAELAEEASKYAVIDAESQRKLRRLGLIGD